MIKKNLINSLLKDTKKITKFSDYLKLKIDKKDRYFIDLFDKQTGKIDFDNSNISIIDFGIQVTFQKTRIDNGVGLIASIAYNDLSIPVFIIAKYDDHIQKKFETRGKLEYYGQFFRLKEIGVIENYFFDEKYLNNLDIMRYDYKLDFFDYKANSNGYISYKKFGKQRKELTTHGHNSVIHSWSLGDKKNHTCILRGYDKIKDTANKGKFALYSDYFDFKSVFRIEFEFGVKFTKGFKFKDLKELQKKVIKYIGIDDEIYRKKIYHTYEKIDLSDSFKKLRYFKLTRGYIKGLIQNKINPFQFVIQEMLIAGYSPEIIKEYMNTPDSILDTYSL